MTQASSQEEQPSGQVKEEPASSQAKTVNPFLHIQGSSSTFNYVRTYVRTYVIKNSLQGMTPLLIAAATGQGNVVQMLLQMGANGHHFDDDDQGVLSLAYNCNPSTYNMLQNLELPDGSFLEWRPVWPKPERRPVCPKTYPVERKTVNASKLLRHWGGQNGLI